MDKEYFFHCSGCEKPDKEYPMNFDDYEYGEPVYNTPKTSEHMWARADAYGIYTGLYCDKCYDDPHKYTYRKDRYYDPAYAGERMEPDE